MIMISNNSDRDCVDETISCSFETNFVTFQEFNDLHFEFNHPYLLNYNIRSFSKNIDEFLILLSVMRRKPSIIILTETWITKNILEICNIDGYKPFHTIRSSRRSGGVSVFVEEGFNCKIIPEYCVDNGIMETCVVSVTTSFSELIVFGVYRSHDHSIEEFDDNLMCKLSQEFFRDKNIVLTGDFNLNLLDQTNNSINQFKCNVQSLNFTSFISKPTRISPDHSNSSLLDHIWINFNNFSLNGIILIDTTDHFPTFINLSILSPTHDKNKIEFRDRSEVNLINLENDLMRLDWNNFFMTDLNCSVEKFCKLLDNLYIKNCPKKVKFISTKRISKPWINHSLLELMKEKSNYFRSYKRGIISFNTYRIHRNDINRKISRAKADYYHRYFQNNSGDPKNLWKGLRDIIGSSVSKSKIEQIKFDREVITNPGLIAQKFNQYFTNIASDLDRSIPLSSISPTAYVTPVTNSLFLDPTSPIEIETIIGNMKSVRCGLNTFPAVLLKKFRNILSYPISIFINKAFSTGTFPTCLKIASVTPIFKSGNISDITCYRPISVLPLLSKIFERAIVNRISSFANKFNLFSICQFGF